MFIKIIELIIIIILSILLIKNKGKKHQNIHLALFALIIILFVYSLIF